MNSTLENGKVMRSAYLSRSSSHGIGQLTDGRVLHLSASEDGDGISRLQLELFGPDGALQKVGRIERFMHDRRERKAVNRATSVHLKWIDRRDRLYLMDYRTGFPILRVMRLEE